LMLCQLYINVQTLFPGLFGGDGCNQDRGSISKEVVWIYVQFTLNSLITIFQLFIWIWHLKASAGFCCSFCKVPTSKDAQVKEFGRQYAILRALEDEPELYEMKVDERNALIDQYVPDNMDEDFIYYKKTCKELGKIKALQVSCANARAFVGALGAIIEPLLAAMTAMSHTSPQSLIDAALISAEDSPNITAAMQMGAGAVQKVMTDLIKTAADSQAQAISEFDKCMATRSLSTSMGAFIAFVGLKQQDMKRAYTRLVILDQVVDADIEQAKASGKRKINSAVVESEISNILGDHGKRLMTYTSGRDVPEQD